MEWMGGVEVYSHVMSTYKMMEQHVHKGPHDKRICQLTDAHQSHFCLGFFFFFSCSPLPSRSLHCALTREPYPPSLPSRTHTYSLCSDITSLAGMPSSSFSALHPCTSGPFCSTMHHPTSPFLSIPSSTLQMSTPISTITWSNNTPAT